MQPTLRSRAARLGLVTLLSATAIPLAGQGQNVIYRLNEDALAGSMREFFGQFRSCQQSLR